MRQKDTETVLSMLRATQEEKQMTFDDKDTIIKATIVFISYKSHDHVSRTEPTQD